MARKLEESLLEQVQALKSIIDEVMVSRTDKEDDYGDFMWPSPTEPDSRVPESSHEGLLMSMSSPSSRTSLLWRLFKKLKYSK